VAEAPPGEAVDPAGTARIGAAIGVTVITVLLLLALTIPRAAADATVTPPPFGVGANAGRFPLCDGLDPPERTRLRAGLAVMRRTDEGERLFSLLLDRRVCVGVAELPGRTLASARAVERRPGDWSASTVLVDEARLPRLAVDELAVTLVHEAIHIDRAVRGLRCDSPPAGEANCTRLPSGALLEEEVAAHAAEAEWWEAVYGRDGKGTTWIAGGDHDALLAAYHRGEDAFRAYVEAWRGPAYSEGR